MTGASPRSGRQSPLQNPEELQPSFWIVKISVAASAAAHFAGSDSDAIHTSLP